MAYKVTRQKVVAAAMECLGAPFLHQGRTLEMGIDCVGLLHVILTKIKYPKIHDVEGYKRSPSALLIRETLDLNFDQIPLEEVGLGDIYLMRIGLSQKPKHVSVLVEDRIDLERGIVPQVIHTYAMGDKGRTVLDNLSFWKNKCVLGYRIKGLVV